MNIEHVAIYVNNLEVEKDFFVKYFGAKVSDQFTYLPNNFTDCFLTFNNGLLLELWHVGMLDPKKAKYRSGYHHIAINVGDRNDVNNLTRQMADDGIYIIAAPRTTGDGYYASIIADPEDNEIEILAGY